MRQSRSSAPVQNQHRTEKCGLMSLEHDGEASAQSSMMNLFMSGLPVEVLSAVADLYTNGSHIDKSLLSKFLSSAMRRVSYPFSAKFAHVIAKIIVDANLRYRTDEEKAMLREFFDETKESLEPELQKKLQAVVARQ